jgi:hypothetical protein
MKHFPTIRRCCIAGLAVVALLHSSCWKCPDPFRAAVAAFENDSKAGIEKITLKKVDPFGSVPTIDHEQVFVDPKIISDIQRELVFPESPALPPPMHHSGNVMEAMLECMTTNGRIYAIHLTFRRGQAGKGVEYKLALPQDKEGVQPVLPGNYSIGNGFSVGLFDQLTQK